jgi:hypothetical protein
VFSRLTATEILQNIIAMEDQDWGKKVLITDAITMLFIDSAIEMNELTLAGIAGTFFAFLA